MDFTKGPLKDLLEAGRLFTFFLIGGPVVNGGDYYHDINDEPIDCNIYHPKYGYPGFIADHYETTITSYSATVYQDGRTGKWIWCKDNYNLLCEHPDGTFTNKDGEQVIIVPQLISRPHLATIGNFDEYREIYDREFNRCNLPESMRDDISFKKTLHKRVQKLIDLHNEKSTTDTLDDRLLTLADKFQEYLLPSDNSKKKDHELEHNIILINSPTTLLDLVNKQAIALQLSLGQRGILLTEYELRAESYLGAYEDNERNNFNDMPLSQVRKWFKQLAHRKNKEGVCFLSESQIEIFITYAFVKCLPVPEKLTVNYGPGGYWNFVRLFKEFYDECTTSNSSKLAIDERPAIRDKYISLLTDNFAEYEFAEVKDNFRTQTGLTWKPVK